MTEPKTFQEAAYLVAKETADLVIMKQRDYGPRNITDFGEYGILVRLNDKLQRLINLFKANREPANETVDDTWDDVGGYALVRKILQRGWFELPMGGELSPIPSGGDKPRGAKPKPTPLPKPSRLQGIDEVPTPKRVPNV